MVIRLSTLALYRNGTLIAVLERPTNSVDTNVNNNLEYDDETAVPGQHYYYEVVVDNEDPGNASSPLSIGFIPLSDGDFGYRKVSEQSVVNVVVNSSNGASPIEGIDIILSGGHRWLSCLPGYYSK